MNWRRSIKIICKSVPCSKHFSMACIRRYITSIVNVPFVNRYWYRPNIFSVLLESLFLVNVVSNLYVTLNNVIGI